MDKHGEVMEIDQLKVMVAEDEDFQRSHLVRVLKSLGIKAIIEAIDGESALELIQQAGQSLDVLISDLNMPGMDGMELLRHLSQSKIKIGIILASALDPALISSIEMMASAYGIQILGAIEKPVTKLQIELLLKKYLSSHPTAQSVAKPKINSSRHEYLDGLKNNEFILFFQPKIEIATGLILGAEALVRWQHSQQGLLLPDQFIPFMEQANLMDDLTWVVLKKSASYCRMWLKEGYSIIPSVNLSVSTLSDPTIAERIRQSVLEEGIEPSNMMLEVTESATTSNIGSVLENLSRLRMKGFGLSIDDFGTGYSSMQQLTRIPYTELKIDKSFVTRAALKESTRAILESSLEMARKLKIKSVAEGVETQEDWNYLRELGCTLAQGYFISPPIPGDKFLDWCKEWMHTGYPRIMQANRL